MFSRKHWAQRRVAFAGATLAALALASAFFAREISRGLGPDPPPSERPASLPKTTPVREPTAPQASVPIATPPPRQPSSSDGVTAPEMTIQVEGDGNTITLRPSEFTPPEPGFQLNGDGGTSDFLVGPRQTARVELTGDGNRVHVAASLQDRVTVVDKGDGNTVAN